MDESGEKSEGRREMDKWYWAFSSGGRMCLGNNFAVMRKSKPASSMFVCHSIGAYKGHLNFHGCPRGSDERW